MILRLILPWIVLGSLHALVAVWPRPGVRARWALAALALLAPLLSSSVGFASVAATTCAVIFAARLPDLLGYQSRHQASRFEVAVWLSLPVAGARPHDAALRRVNRRRALQPLAWALLTRLSWDVLQWGLQSSPGLIEGWLGLRVVMTLFFVLQFTALAQLVLGVALLLGFQAEPAFDAPLVSRSPREFWSRRWNKFVARFLLRYVALRLPKASPAGLRVAAVFVASAVLHEYFVWGATHALSGLGYMSLFFAVQGLAVWVETRWGWPRPAWLGNALTFAWMIATAPLFFYPVRACLPAFGYPVAWLPF